MMKRRVSYTRAFMGLVRRDFRVLGREIGPFSHLASRLNPLLFLFIFTYVMPAHDPAEAS